MAFADYRDVIRQLKKTSSLVKPSCRITRSASPRSKRSCGESTSLRCRTARAHPPGQRGRERADSRAQHASARLINNQGEKGEFLLPLNVPSDSGQDGALRRFHFRRRVVDTYRPRGPPRTRDAVSTPWWERGVSIARAVFAFNSTNVEGWGLYAEWMTRPYMPLDGQLISLQYRLMRAAPRVPSTPSCTWVK